MWLCVGRNRHLSLVGWHLLWGIITLQWRHNGHDSVSNHQPHHCLLNRLFWRRSKKTSKLRVTGLCAGNSPVTGEFPAQMTSYAENLSIWWRHHDMFWCGWHYGVFYNAWKIMHRFVLSFTYLALAMTKLRKIIEIDFLNHLNHRSQLLSKLFLSLTTISIWDIFDFTKNYQCNIYKTNVARYILRLHAFAFTFVYILRHRNHYDTTRALRCTWPIKP